MMLSNILFQNCFMSSEDRNSSLEWNKQSAAKCIFYNYFLVNDTRMKLAQTFTDLYYTNILIRIMYGCINRHFTNVFTGFILTQYCLLPAVNGHATMFSLGNIINHVITAFVNHGWHLYIKKNKIIQRSEYQDKIFITNTHGLTSSYRRGEIAYLKTAPSVKLNIFNCSMTFVILLKIL